MIARRLADEAQQQDPAQHDAAGGDAQIQDQPAQTQPRKQKITFDEYQRISTLIVGVMKEYEGQGTENVQQCSIIDRMVQKLILEDQQ